MLRSYNFKEEISTELEKEIKKAKKHTVYFGLHEDDPQTADHIGSVLYRREKYYLHMEGHGIAPKTFEY